MGDSLNLIICQERGAIAEYKQTSVMTSIRCCFAIGPQNSLGPPAIFPAARTYAVKIAKIVAMYPSATFPPHANPAPMKTAASEMRSGTSL